MTRGLTDDEKREIEQRVADAETRTGVEIAVAVIERCDAYPELPWKAFALAAATAGLLAWVLRLGVPESWLPPAVSWDLVLVLGCGAVAALVSVWLPPFARLFLDRHRAEGEARQYAESLFLSRQLFATRGRTAVLLLVGLFERQVVLLPDSGAAARLAPAAAEGVIGRMQPLLRSGEVAQALGVGLDALSGALGAAPPDRGGGGGNEIPNAVLEEGGAS